MIGEVGKSSLRFGIGFAIAGEIIGRGEINRRSANGLDLDGQTDLSPAGPVPALVFPENKLKDSMAAVPSPMELLRESSGDELGDRKSLIVYEDMCTWTAALVFPDVGLEGRESLIRLKPVPVQKAVLMADKPE
jgi:hypothetical protein